MALELGEAVLFIVIGIVIGIAVIFVVMQSRVTRKAQQIYDARRQDLEVQFQQRNQDLDKFVQQRNSEIDSQYRTQYSTEFEKWKAQYLLDHEVEVKAAIEAASKSAVNSSRSSLKGKINEQIAPLFPEFTSKYVAADARFIGSPIDFIIFKNLHTHSNNNDGDRQLVEIVFVEVKTGKSQLNPNERAVRAAVENLRVKYDLLKISLDDKNAVDTVDNNISTEITPDLDATKKYAICPRCQFGLKCDCNSCPDCPNNFTMESDTTT